MRLLDLQGLQACSEFCALRGDPKLAVLVDFSWLLHRSFYAYDLSFPIGGIEVKTGDIYGVLRTISGIAHKKPTSVILLCLDGSAGARKEIDPAYKGNREDTSKAEVYRKQEEILRAACILPNVFLAYHPDFEADDVIGTLARALSGAGLEVVIFASDKDFYQLIGDKIRVASKLTGKTFEIVTEEEILKKLKVKPPHLLMFRSLTGDASDNLPGYLRLPTKLAAKIAEQFKTPDELLQGSPEVASLEEFYKGLTKPQRKWVEKIQADPQTLKKNFEMMRLRPVGRPGLFRLPGDEAILEKYGMTSVKALLKSLLVPGESIHEESL